MTQSADRPRIRLKPKANARGLRHGFPWVYANDIVTDRRTRKIPAGALAVLEDEKRAPIALVAVNPEVQDHVPGAGPRYRRAA